MSKKPWYFLAAILLVGWLFDFLFWKQSFGVNYTIFIVLTLAVGVVLLLLNGLPPNKKSLLLLIPFLFFSAVPFLRREPLTVGLAYTFSILSLGLFAATYRGGRWVQYVLGDYIGKLAVLFAHMFVSIPDFMKEQQQLAAEQETERKPLPVKPIIRGLLIAMPILLCFGSLLASADAVFQERITDLFDFEDAFENILRLILILLAAYLVGGAYLHAANSSDDEKLLGEEKPWYNRFLGFTETAIVFGSVAALFLFFVSIQFQYLFGGENNIGVEGFTYSQYARRGFRELWIVALFSLLMVIGFRLVTKFETAKQRKIYSILSVAILANVMVILASSYHRLMLAIDWHSYSRLRLYPRIFIICLGVLFLIVVLLEIFDKERYFTLAALLVSFGYAAALFFFNVDASIAQVNVDRAEELNRFSVYYTASLSTDVVPALAEAYQDPAYSDKVHEYVGASLVCIQNMNRDLDQDEDEETSWKSFNYSVWKAQTVFDEMFDDLDDYVFEYNKSIRRHRVQMPDFGWIFCE